MKEVFLIMHICTLKNGDIILYSVENMNDVSVHHITSNEENSNTHLEHHMNI